VVFAHLFGTGDEASLSGVCRDQQFCGELGERLVLGVGEPPAARWRLRAIDRRWSTCCRLP
jgi:hypothetical protein